MPAEIPLKRVDEAGRTYEFTAYDFTRDEAREHAKWFNEQVGKLGEDYSVDDLWLDELKRFVKEIKGREFESLSLSEVKYVLGRARDFLGGQGPRDKTPDST